MHSIAEAIKNPKRGAFELFATEDSLKDLQKLHFQGKKLPESVTTKVLSLHKLKDEGRATLLGLGFKEQRVPSNIFLKTAALNTLSLNDLYKNIESSSSFRALMLDQVTDVHNLGAIMRTAAFYNIDCVIYGKKGEERLSPGFFRIASGAAEHLPLVQAANLSKVLRKFNELNVSCLGLAEEAENTDSTLASEKVCLVMGAEETGLSNAVRRSLETFVSLPAQGPIKSLNVSVAAALAMEKFLNKL